MTASTDRRLLADTDVVSLLFSGRAPTSLHETIGDSTMVVSVITLGEALKGAHAAGWGMRRIGTLLSYIDREFEVLPVNEAVAERWALLNAQCMSRGFTPGSNDAWIAATAVVADVPVISEDNGFRQMARHYPALRVVP